MSEKGETSRKSLDPTVMAAIITVVGGILVTLISTLANKPAPSPTPGPPAVIVVTNTSVPTAVPTDTVPPGDPTSTPAPDTPTPLPTSTATLIPVGVDWAGGCISTLWVPYPSSIQTMEKDGCLSQPVGVFFAGNGRLSFLYENRLSSAEVYGLFAPLPASGTVELKVYLRDLKNSNLWMGVFAEPTIDSKGLLMSIPSGDVKKRPFVQWDMPGPVKVTSTTDFQQNPGIYSIKFDFNNLSVKAVVMKNAFGTNTVPVISAQKWLFIGYQGVNGSNRIEAEFFDLVVGN
jgi:hypothetical protein